MIEKCIFMLASTDRMDIHQDLANKFLDEILDSPGALITDESSLTDFNGCGLDDRDDLAGLGNEAFRAYWEAWVVERVCERYLIEPFPVTIDIVELFESIDRAASGR